MRIHFFTAPFLLSLFTPGSKKQEKKGILPPFPKNSAFYVNANIKVSHLRSKCS